MVRHCVVIRFTAEASQEAKQTALDAIRGLPALVPEIQGYTAGFDTGRGPGNGDMAVVADFDSFEAYQVYATHPAHVRVINERVRPILAERSAVQFEVPADL